MTRDTVIVAAGPRARVSVPPGAEVIDGKGLTIMPGLVDAHLHGMQQPQIAARFLRNGVTHTLLGFEKGAFTFRLEMLVEAGLSPAQVVVAGTMESARFLRADQRLGSIEPGKLADLVLVDGDPLADIRVMRKIKRVMLNGRWLIEEPTK